MSGFRRIDKRGAPEWLYGWYNAKDVLVSFWVRHRKKDLYLEQKIEGRINSWVDAHKLGIELIDTARGFKKLGKEDPDMIRCEVLAKEIVALKKGKSDSTYEGNEIMARVHVIPYLNEHCPFVRDLNGPVWESYKIYKRLNNPTVALFNHWKFFLNLGKYARQKGAIKERIVFEFDEEKEDFRKEGMLIPDEHFKLMLRHANQTWRDRMIMQRLTGMRPGEVRCLQRDRVEFGEDHAVFKLKKEDTKTRMPRNFAVVSAEILEILRRRCNHPQSVFLFPARGKPGQCMDKGPAGWKSAIEAANIELATEAEKRGEKAALIPTDYTPHDLRHTYLTHEFKKPGNSHALICYQAGLSLEEAQATYLHFNAADTLAMAKAIAGDAAKLVVSSVKNLGRGVMQVEDKTTKT